MDEKTKQRIEEIAKRLNRYYVYKKCNNFPDRKKATTHELQKRAPADIKFLLNLILSLQPELDSIQFFYR